LNGQAIEQTFAKDTPGFTLDFTIDETIDVPNLLAKRIHSLSPVAKPWAEVLANEKEVKSKESHVKRRLTSASACMTKAMLDQTDPHGDVLSWFNEMQRLITAFPV